MVGTVTDYDVWHEEDVEIGTVIDNIAKNEAAVRDIIKKTLENMNSLTDDCTCNHALVGAILTDPMKIPANQRERLKDILGDYLK